MDTANLYQSLVRLLSNVVDAYTVALFVVDPKSKQLHLIASQSLSKHFSQNLPVEPEQSGLLSQVYKVGQIVSLDKPPEAVASMLPFYSEGESYIKGVFVAPVGEGAGVLYVDTKKKWGFNDKEQKWILEIAGVFHGLLQRQSSVNQQENYARILELWYNLDQGAFGEFSLEHYFHLVVEKCSRFLGVDYGFLVSNKQGEDRYHLLASTSNTPQSLVKKHFTLRQGLISWVLQNQKPLFITRLNPELPEHFLFLPGESLPHHGTFWGLPIPTSSDHAFVLTFLGQQPVQWNPDEYYAISHAIHFLHLILEHFYWREEYERLQVYDLTTGLYNALAFETSLEEILTMALQNSTPCTLALVQYEPWQVLYARSSPHEVRQWQQHLALKLSSMLPEQTQIGQITENRYALLFPEMTPQEADQYLLSLLPIGRQFFSKTMEKISLQGYFGWAGFPQEGTRIEELWPLVYHRLFEAFHS
jgi:GGDEF domain-containing protein